MNLLYENRPIEDKILINKICLDSLIPNLPEKPENNEFAFVFCDGRPDMEINKPEHFACFKACKIHSEFNYPIFCFIANSNNFLNNDMELIKKLRINIIKINPITTHKAYSDFCIKELFFKLPNNIENILTVSADSWPLKSGFEKFIIENELDMIGPILGHVPALDVLTQYGWQPMHLLHSVPIGINGGWSYRKASKMRLISTKFSPYKVKERYSSDFERVNEDLYFFYLGVGSGILKCPTIQQCLKFGIDPLTNKEYNDFTENKKSFFGYHYIKYE